MKRFLPIVAVLSLCACNAIGSLLHDGEVVASVGEYKLYSTELAGYIPAGTSSEDSTRLAESYIEGWTRDMKFILLAEKELSKEEKDVSRELEDYKRTLLRYRYEQKYINQRLDTAITPFQVEDYYKAHQEMFRLSSPVVKAKFAIIPEKSAHLTALKKLMSADDGTEDAVVSDSLAYVYTSRFTDFGDKWTPLAELAVEMGTDTKSLQASLHKGFLQEKGDDGNLKLAYVTEIVKSGEIAPMLYCWDRIRDIILSNRKQALSAALEQELMKDN